MRLGISPFGVLSALWLASACSFDWDSLEPHSGVAMGGDAQGGADGTGGSDTGGASSGGEPGSGGTSSAPACSMSVLVNSGFEEIKNTQPRNWAVLGTTNGAGGGMRTEASIRDEGERSMAIDTTSADPTGAYQLLVGTPMADMIPLDGATQVTATLALRVEELDHGLVTVSARFLVGPADFVDQPLATLDQASPDFVTAGDVIIDVPEGATEVGLVIGVPDGALVYVDDACAELD